MIVVLAEKPSVARDLARNLKANNKRQGYFEGNGYQVTWAYGHLVELKEPHEYNPAFKRWRLEDLPIVPEAFALKVIPTKLARGQFKIIRDLFRAASGIICATDAGREGELIFRRILALSGCARKPSKRLWLSSLTPQAIRNALAAMKPLSAYDPLADAARCRSEADWIVGLNATRGYTVRYGKNQLWSVGRVQTPVLAMIVGRDDEIRHFKPEKFWELFTRYRDTRFKHTGKRFDKETDAQALLGRVTGQPFTITGITEKRESQKPPLLYDLTALQRDMNIRYNLSAANTLKIVQRLYESQLVTYPRTDSRFLSSDMKKQVPSVLSDLASCGKSTEVGRLNLQQLPLSGRIFNDARVSDHHAIIPTGKSGSLSGLDAKVYQAIVTRFIAVFYPPCEKLRTTVDGESAQLPFQAKGVRVLKPGWTLLYPKSKKPDKEDEQELAAFTKGESGPHTPTIKEGVTKPPRHFNEGTLLSSMETCGKTVEDEQLKEALKERGLGTPATRAQIIETLLTREYIAREGKKNLIATDAGRYLIALVTNPNLKSAELTGEWEGQLKTMEQGKLPAEQFMRDIVDYTQGIIHHADSVDSSTLGNCPQCGKAVIEGQRGFGCSGWQDGCTFVIWKTHAHLTFSAEEARQFLQLGRLRTPQIVGGGLSLLVLAKSGEIRELPVVSGPPKKGRDAPSSDAPLGKCPKCENDVVEGKKAYGCSAWKVGCKFVIWKTIAGKRISASMAKSLLSKGRTSTLKGFKSKAGKPFQAALMLTDGEVKLDFDAKPQAPSVAKSAKPAADSGELGKCPTCGGTIIAGKTAYGCAAWKAGCRFRIYKKIAGKAITPSMVKALLSKGRTRKLKGFKSKAGKPFEAILTMQDSAVKFEFD
jgi:DNA topoisomerase III